jgi:hypothetical protein
MAKSNVTTTTNRVQRTDDAPEAPPAVKLRLVKPDEFNAFMRGKQWSTRPGPFGERYYYEGARAADGLQSGVLQGGNVIAKVVDRADGVECWIRTT